MNRTYELMFIVRPDMVEEDQDKLISTLETAVTSSGGVVKSVVKDSRRKASATPAPVAAEPAGEAPAVTA